MSPADRVRHRLLGMRVDAGADTSGLVETIMQWARGRRSGYVCPLTVKSLLRGSRDMTFRRVVNSADAAPCVDRQLAWWLEGGRVDNYPIEPGRIFLKRLCMRAQTLDIPVGVYGTASAPRRELLTFIQDHFPSLPIVALVPEASSAPKRTQDIAVMRMFNTRGVRLLLVCLGTPMEEEWMLNHKGRVHAVMVGASALMTAGTYNSEFTSPRAPFSGRSRVVGRSTPTTVRLPQWESLRLGWRIVYEVWQKAQDKVDRAHLSSGSTRLRR